MTDRPRQDPDAPVHLRAATLVLVALGGAVGTGLRYGVSEVLPPGRWPVATMSVNVVGAFALGLLVAVLARSGADVGLRRRVRLMVGSGLLGSFTTYSALALEVLDPQAWGAGTGWAWGYGVSSVLAGLVTAGLGLAVGQRLPRRGRR